MDYNPACLEALWMVVKLEKLQTCDKCHEVLEPDELVYRPAGFFSPHGVVNMTSGDLGVSETICVECAHQRRVFLTEALKVIETVRVEQMEHLAQSGKKQ